MPSHNHGSAGSHSHSLYYRKNCGSGSERWGITGSNWEGSGGAMTAAGAHTHSSNGSGSGHTHTLSSHTHSIAATTTGAASNATTSAASNNNNMPPYLAVYVWQRVA